MDDKKILVSDSLQETLWRLEEVRKGFNQIIEIGGKNGSYCCYNCTIAFLRTLAVTKTDARDEILDKGLDKIKKAQLSDGRWRGFPFYYTLLFLSELDSPYAKNELKHAKKAAERLLKHYSGSDRISLFRRLALKAASNAI